MKHTAHSLEMLMFLEKYPNRWHSITSDTATLKAFCKPVQLHYDIELNVYKQIRLIREDKWTL